MDLASLLTAQWQSIAANPLLFILTVIVCVGLGFGFGRLLYGERLSTADARTTAAQEEATRLRERQTEDTSRLGFLEERVAVMQKALDAQPRIHVGHKPPEPGAGKEGDLFIVLEERQLPEAGLFLRAPARTLETAIAEAIRSARPIFAVIFDPSRPSKGRLTHSLGHFLEYDTTRELIDRNFVAALVESSDRLASAIMPPDDPLERPRWAVLDATGRLLLTEGVSANPEEGLKASRKALETAQRAR